MKPIFVLAILLLYSSWASAWTAVAVLGEVWIEEGEHRTAVVQSAVVPSDALVATGVGARLELRDGANVLRMGAKSKLRLRPIGAGSDPLKLLYGKLRAQVRPLAGQQFRIETRAAVSGVRGTEYFLQTDESHDFVCTLEGLVEVESKISGQSVLVPPRAGVEVAPGRPFSVQPTADDLVDTWVGETGTVSRVVVSDGYRELPLRYHATGGKWLYGVRGQALVGRADHVGYNSVGTKDHNWFSQYRLSPALRWGQTLAVAWEPRLMWHSSDESMILDQDPPIVRKSYAQASLGELYADAALDPVQVRIGVQSVQWNDGRLFSIDSWRLDPILFRAVRASGAWSGHYVDVLAIHRGDRSELGGEVRADILALKYDYKTWLSIIAAERSYAAIKGRRVAEVMLQSGRRVAWADYRMTLWHQSGGHNMMEGGLGAYPWGERRVRTGVSVMHADPDFTAGYEPVYELGYSRTFARTNLRQYRGKVSFASDRWDLFFEWLHSQSVGRSAAVKWSGRFRDLLSEQDLGASTSLNENLKLMLVGFRAAPTSAMSASSPVWPSRVGYGVTASLQYTY